jgi:hypothetical protein
MDLTYSYIYHWYVLTVLGHDSSHICPTCRACRLSAEEASLSSPLRALPQHIDIAFRNHSVLLSDRVQPLIDLLFRQRTECGIGALLAVGPGATDDTDLELSLLEVYAQH